jgi:hypothetical protein
MRSQWGGACCPCDFEFFPSHRNYGPFIDALEDLRISQVSNKEHVVLLSSQTDSLTPAGVSMRMKQQARPMSKGGAAEATC